jgi:hypothetical protein
MEMVDYSVWEGVAGPLVGLAVRMLFGPTPVFEAVVVPLLGPALLVGF